MGDYAHTCALGGYLVGCDPQVWIREPHHDPSISIIGNYYRDVPTSVPHGAA